LPAEIDRLACDSGTRLGRPVLPLVCSTSAVSSSAGGVTAAPADTPASVTVPLASISTARIGTVLPRGAAGLVDTLGRQQQDLGVGVVEVELELFLFVGGIQRGRGAGHRRRQERHDVRNAVGQRHSDPIAALHPGRRQRRSHVLHLLAESHRR
jgi:hypothetical protein